jgi:hypothetical protein
LSVTAPANFEDVMIMHGLSWSTSQNCGYGWQLPNKHLISWLDREALSYNLVMPGLSLGSCT